MRSVQQGLKEEGFAVPMTGCAGSVCRFLCKRDSGYS